MGVPKKIVLNDGNIMPVVALGVWRSGENTQGAVSAALKNGYRHIDTAAVYKNEVAVGAAIKDSGIDRADIFVTTKLWNDDIRSGNIEAAFYRSLERLGLDYVDLYLIHWPADGYVRAYQVMEKLQKEGKIRSIGVSNFKRHHLETLLANTTVIPAINQIEFNPLMQDQELVEYCQEKNIIVEAWSPLGQGSSLTLKPIVDLAQKHGRSPAQIILRWLLQKKIVVLPKSVREKRIIENRALFDFALSEADMATIDSLNINQRMGPDPDTFDF